MLQEIARQTGDTPRALRDRPSLQAQNRHLLEAFYELSASRSLGEVPQPLTPQAVLAYCDLFGIRAGVEREALYRVVRRLDGVYLREAMKQREKAARKS